MTPAITPAERAAMAKNAARAISAYEKQAAEDVKHAYDVVACWLCGDFSTEGRDAQQLMERHLHSRHPGEPFSTAGMTSN